MAIEAHVIIDGNPKPVRFTKLGEAMAELNAASFAGISGIAVVAVGRTQQEAGERVEASIGKATE